MEVFLADEQRLPIEGEPLLVLARRVLMCEGQRPETEVNVLLVDEGSMSELHERYMGQEGPTDVLAFPLDEDEETGPGWPPGRGLEGSDYPYLLGDVVICPSVAATQAERAGWSVQEECSLLLVHGLLHLLGHDHADREGAARMKERQAYYLGLADA
jgi:probable rRNA maturation factor